MPARAIRFGFRMLGLCGAFLGLAITQANASSTLGQHVVRGGETLFCIGRAYGVYPPAIAEANGIALNIWLIPDQKLQIPATPWGVIPSGPVCVAQFTSPYANSPTRTPIATGEFLGQHLVQKGETLFCIGRAYGVWPAAIAEANRLASPYLIVPGQVLAVPAVAWGILPPGPICQAQFPSPFVSHTPAPTATGGGGGNTTPVATTPGPGSTKTPIPTRTAGSTKTPSNTPIPPDLSQ